MIVRLDGVNVGVCAAQEYFVEEVLLGAYSLESFTQGVAVLLKWSANNRLKAFSEVTAGLRMHIFHEIALFIPFEGIFDTFNLKRAHGRQNLDESLLICTEAFHSFAECRCRARHVHI